MVDVESATVEIRRGKNKKERKKKKPQGKNIMSASATKGGHNQCRPMVSKPYDPADAISVFSVQQTIQANTSNDTRLLYIYLRH